MVTVLGAVDVRQDASRQKGTAKLLITSFLWATLLILIGTVAKGSAAQVSVDLSERVAHYVSAAKRVVHVETSEQLIQAIAQLAPGDLVLLADGTYGGNQALTIFNRQGSSELPMVIAAENPGKAILTGTFHFMISYSSYITIDGLVFNTHPAGIRGEVGAITMRHTHHSRITRNQFSIREVWGANPGIMLDWVVIRGRGSQHNRIDHNLFRDKLQRGRFLIIGLHDANDSMPQYTRVDHNHFQFMAPLCSNGMEAVVLGGGHPQSAHYMAHMDAHTLFEYNLLERVDGECAEIISLKSSSNIIRYNTILETRGRIYFRAGDRNEVYGNYFLGNGEPGSGGVLLYGEDQVVLSNYFHGLAEPAVAIGDANAETFDPQRDLAPYTQVIRAQIAFNTLVGNEVAIARHRRDGAPLTGKEVLIANNLIYSESDVTPLDPTLLDLPDLAWQGNLFYAPHSSLQQNVEERNISPDQITVADPKLEPFDLHSHTIYLPSESSPALGSALAPYSEAATDIEGRPREGRPSVGAFEVVEGAVLHGPLTHEDVGPFARSAE